MAKYLDENGLLYYNNKLKTEFDKKVDKEHKTNSESEYKVLSDNNLTDELVQKIKDAGSSSFNGSYNNLTDIPTLDGEQIKGTLTKEGLGIASASDLLQAQGDIANAEADILELQQAGYQTADDVESAITKKGYQTASDVESAITKKGYQTAEDVEATLATKKYQTAEEVDAAITAKGYQTETQVETKIESYDYVSNTELNAKSYATETYVDSKVSSVYKYKGSVSTYGDLSQYEDTAEEGDVYNVESDGQNYAWTGSAWDSLGATVDLSAYWAKADLTAIQNADIDSIMQS